MKVFPALALTLAAAAAFLSSHAAQAAPSLAYEPDAKNPALQKPLRLAQFSVQLGGKSPGGGRTGGIKPGRDSGPKSPGRGSGGKGPGGINPGAVINGLKLLQMGIEASENAKKGQKKQTETTRRKPKTRKSPKKRSVKLRPPNKDPGRKQPERTNPDKTGTVEISCRGGTVLRGACLCAPGSRTLRLSKTSFACAAGPTIVAIPPLPPPAIGPGVDTAGLPPDDRQPSTENDEAEKPPVPPLADLPNGPRPPATPADVPPPPRPPARANLAAGVFDAPHRPGEIVVFLPGTFDDVDVAALARTYQMTPLESASLELSGRRIERFALPANSRIEEMTNLVLADPRVISAQPNLLYRMPADALLPRPADPGTVPEFEPRKLPQKKISPLRRAYLERYGPETTQPSKATPEASLSRDQTYKLASGSDLVPAASGSQTNSGLQYALASLDVGKAHGLAMGRETLVAVVDTGIDARHPALSDVVAGRYSAIGDRKPAPSEHGTAIAGIVAAHRTVQGVAPEAKLLDVQAFYAADDAGGGKGGVEASTFILARGVDWAFTQGARIFNMSFAGPADPALEDLIEAGHARGAMFLAAAGNEGPGARPVYPAAYANVIAITAIDERDKLYERANHGRYVAAAAPGVDILVLSGSDAYGFMSGTSMAAAHASGVAALMQERRKDLSARTLAKVIRETARDLGPVGPDELFGAGRLDADAAVRKVSASGGL